MAIVKLTIIESRCRGGYCKKGDEYIVEDLCPPICHELWNTVYPMVYALQNEADLDYGNGRAKCFGAKCPDENRVCVHGEVIEKRSIGGRSDMRLGEVCLCTNDVISLADFYKKLLEVDNNSDDSVHQTIIAEETQLTIYNDGTRKNNNNQNIAIAFSVDNIEKEYQKVQLLGAEIIEEPTPRPWGAINMSFYDPDRNIVFLRSFSAER